MTPEEQAFTLKIQQILQPTLNVLATELDKHKATDKDAEAVLMTVVSTILLQASDWKLDEYKPRLERFILRLHAAPAQHLVELRAQQQARRPKA